MIGRNSSRHRLPPKAVTAPSKSTAVARAATAFRGLRVQCPPPRHHHHGGRLDITESDHQPRMLPCEGRLAGQSAKPGYKPLTPRDEQHMYNSSSLRDVGRDVMMANITHKYCRSLLAQSENLIKAWDQRHPEPDPPPPVTLQPHLSCDNEGGRQETTPWQRWHSRRERMLGKSKIENRRETGTRILLPHPLSRCDRRACRPLLYLLRRCSRQGHRRLDRRHQRGHFEPRGCAGLDGSGLNTPIRPANDAALWRSQAS